MGHRSFSYYSSLLPKAELSLVAFGVSLGFSSGVLSIAIHSATAPKVLSRMALGLYGTFVNLGLMVGSTIFGLSWATFGPSLSSSSYPALHSPQLF